MAKTTRFNRVLTVAIFASLVLHLTVAEARPHRRSASSGPRYASITMDAQSGRVLDQQNANAALPPASLTKMMTLFLTFEALENGRLHMNKYLTVTANAVRQPPSKLGLKVGERITVKQAILALVTRSANDVAYAMAETIGGSEKRFTQMMTERARSLGMRNSYFANASGLPNPLQKSSAYDMAILGRALMQYFPQHYHFFSTKFFTYKGQIITTHNNLINRYKGMDGFKTGFTAASGFNLVASAVRNNRRVIVAVFGGRSAVTRDNHVADLMNRGLDQLARGQMGTQVASAAPIQKLSNNIQVVAVQSAQTTSTRQVTTQIVPTNAPIAVATPVTVTQVIQQTAQAVPVATSSNATATTTQTTTTTVSSNDAGTGFSYPEGWSPDGGAVKTLQAPNTAQPVASAQPGAIQPVSYLPTAMNKNQNWGIQVGAYSTPSLSQQAIQIVQSRLKTMSITAQPVVVPSVTPSGTIYRARMIGMTAENAAKACQLLTECMAFTVR